MNTFWNQIVEKWNELDREFHAGLVTVPERDARMLAFVASDQSAWIPVWESLPPMETPVIATTRAKLPRAVGALQVFNRRTVWPAYHVKDGHFQTLDGQEKGDREVIAWKLLFPAMGDQFNGVEPYTAKDDSPAEQLYELLSKLCNGQLEYTTFDDEGETYINCKPILDIVDGAMITDSTSHPDYEVMHKLEQLGYKVIRTDGDSFGWLVGAIVTPVGRVSFG